MAWDWSAGCEGSVCKRKVPLISRWSVGTVVWILLTSMAACAQSPAVMGSHRMWSGLVMCLRSFDILVMYSCGCSWRTAGMTEVSLCFWERLLRRFRRFGEIFCLRLETLMSPTIMWCVCVNCSRIFRRCESMDL